MKPSTAILIATSVVCFLLGGATPAQAHQKTNAQRFALGLPPLRPAGMKMKRVIGGTSTGNAGQERGARVHQRRQNGPSAVFQPARPRQTTLPANDASIKSGYFQTCSNSLLSTTANSGSLTSTCDKFDDDNTFQTTTLALNDCVTNTNGQLGPGINAFRSCNTCSLSGSTLSCTCDNGQGQDVQTSYDLNNVVGNSDGTLQCYQSYGSGSGTEAQVE